MDVANPNLLDPEDYNINKYDALKWLYVYLSSKTAISVSGKDAFAEEIAAIRK